MTPAREIAAAKINLALHVRGRREDGRHDIETVFAFCIDGDQLEGQFHPGDAAGTGFALEIDGPFARDLEGTNLIEKAWGTLRARVGDASNGYTRLVLKKNLPVASGLGGGSADAAAALRLLTSLWRIDPAHASAAAPGLGSDVPACLLSLSARGSGTGDELELLHDSGIGGTPLLLVNPLVPLSTREVFARWDGVDRGPLADWRDGRNDLEAAAMSLVPQIGGVLNWLRRQAGAGLVRMSGSGASCFALFDSDEARDAATDAVPSHWWRLATKLR